LNGKITSYNYDGKIRSENNYVDGEIF